MGRKRAFTDSTNRDSYILDDEHENHPAELTRSNQFLSLKDACEGTVEPEVPASAFIQKDSRAKSEGFLDIDIPGGAMIHSGEAEREEDNTSSTNTHKTFVLGSRGDMYDSLKPSSPRATWLDSPRTERRGVTVEQLKFSDSNNSLQCDSDRAPLKRVNSDPSIADLERFSKLQEEAVGNVDWRRTDAHPLHAEREEFTIPGTVTPSTKQKIMACEHYGSSSTVGELDVLDLIAGEPKSRPSNFNHSGTLSPLVVRRDKDDGVEIDHSGSPSHPSRYGDHLDDYASDGDHSGERSFMEGPSTKRGAESKRPGHSGILSSSRAALYAGGNGKKAKGDCAIM